MNIKMVKLTCFLFLFLVVRIWNCGYWYLDCLGQVSLRRTADQPPRDLRRHHLHATGHWRSHHTHRISRLLWSMEGEPVLSDDSKFNQITNIYSVADPDLG